MNINDHGFVFYSVGQQIGLTNHYLKLNFPTVKIGINRTL